MLTHRVFQLKLVGRHVVQRRKETFGIIHILEGVLGWLSRSGYADAGTDIEQVLHIHIATVLSSAIWLVDQSGKELVLGQSHHKPLAAVVAHRCVEKGSSRRMCYGARYLLGALSLLLFMSI